MLSSLFYQEFFELSLEIRFITNSFSASLNNPLFAFHRTEKSFRIFLFAKIKCSADWMRIHWRIGLQKMYTKQQIWFSLYIEVQLTNYDGMKWMALSIHIFFLTEMPYYFICCSKTKTKSYLMCVRIFLLLPDLIENIFTINPILQNGQIDDSWIEQKWLFSVLNKEEKRNTSNYWFLFHSPNKMTQMNLMLSMFFFLPSAFECALICASIFQCIFFL